MRYLLALLAVPAFAVAAPCDRLDYAEMDAMDKAELLSIRCQSQDTFLAAIQGGDSRTVSRCSSEMDRMDRVIAKKYGIQGKDEERALAITKLFR